MLKHPEVVVVGSLHLDIIVKAVSLPALDETVQGTSWDMASGGKGGNQARWAAKLGAHAAMISRVGNDDFGRKLLASLAEAGVDADGIGIDEQAGSGMSVAILQPDGEYGAVIVSGSNLEMRPATAVSSLQALGKAAILLLQNEVSEAVNIAVAGEAKRMGMKVILNAAPAKALAPELMQNIDFLVVNRIEAAKLSERLVSTPEDAVAASQILNGLCPAVVVTLGNLGLVVSERGKSPLVIEAPKVDAVSAHGAGDCFVGQLAVALVQGTSLVEACEKANRTAASYVAGQISLSASIDHATGAA